jgi:hypothetical protein
MDRILIFNISIGIDKATNFSLSCCIQVGQCSNAVLTEAEVFWRTVLPDSPLPDPILKLLHPGQSITRFN